MSIPIIPTKPLRSFAALMLHYKSLMCLTLENHQNKIKKFTSLWCEVQLASKGEGEIIHGILGT